MSVSARTVVEIIDGESFRNIHMKCFCRNITEPGPNRYTKFCIGIWTVAHIIRSVSATSVPMPYVKAMNTFLLTHLSFLSIVVAIN